MILGDAAIHNKIQSHSVENALYKNIGPASLDVRLGNSFAKPVAGQLVQLGDTVRYDDVAVDNGGILWLAPGEFCLATTMERIKLPNDEAAFVHGRSSIGRAGLTVQNAGFVDPGFDGHITLELKNESNHDIGLTPGYRVAQIVFMKCDGDTKGYDGKYNGQVEATGSKMFMDWEAWG
jgi:dCTP deaminase